MDRYDELQTATTLHADIRSDAHSSALHETGTYESLIARSDQAYTDAIRAMDSGDPELAAYELGWSDGYRELAEQ